MDQVFNSGFANPLLTLTEISHVFCDWNKTKTDYPRDSSIPALFAQQVIQFPDKVAICHGPLKITYRQLDHLSDQVAFYLLNNGLEKEHLIAVAMPRSIEFIIVILGILKAGGAYLPLDTDFPDARISYVLEDSKVTTLLVNTSQDKIRFTADKNNGCELLSLQEIIEKKNTNPISNNPHTVEIPAANLAYVIYTSGTTGEPKGIEIVHRGVARLVKATNYVEIVATDRVAHLSNVAFDAATFEIWAALLNGAEVVIIDQDILLSPTSIEEVIKQYQISIAFFTTAYFHKIVVRNARAFETLKYLLVGGENISSRVVKYLFTAQAMPQHLIHVYGPTEVTVFSTYHEVSEADIETKIIPIGKTISNTYALVLTKEMQLISLGEIGELYLGGDGLARGYLRRPELTRECFIDTSVQDILHQAKQIIELQEHEENPLAELFFEQALNGEMRLYKTGDLVRWLPNGKLEFVGRKDKQVKLHGFRIELFEIERLLRFHETVLQACVMIREEQEGQKQLVAYIVLQPHQQLQIHSLHEHLKKYLPRYMLPSAYIEIAMIPLTTNGKIDYAALPPPSTGDYVLAEKRQPPRTAQQKEIAEIWSEILHVSAKKISIYDKFFDIGGSSLLAMQVLVDLSSTFHISIKFSEFVSHASIDELDQLISSKQKDRIHERLSPINIVRRNQPLLASMFQKGIWLVQHANPQNVSYNISKLFTIEGELNIQALQFAVSYLVNRHEILRTNFYIEEDSLYQEIHPWQDGNRYMKTIDSCNDAGGKCKSLIEETIGKPFNLQNDDLFRVILYRCSEQQFKLLFCLHHIIVGGYSFKLLFDELTQLYQTLASGNSVNLPPLLVQYADYAAWQYRDLTVFKREKILNYWYTKLQNPPTLDIQLGRARKAIQSYQGAHYYFKIPKALMALLYDRAQRSDVSLYNVFFSVYGLLLARYSRQKDIIIGVPVMNRPHQCLKQLIGFFINTIPLRMNLSSHLTFLEFLQENQNLINEGIDHQALPFDEILSCLNLSIDPSCHPIFQTLFSFNQFEHNNLQLENLIINSEIIHGKTAKVDIELVIDLHQGEFIAHFEYSTDLFDKTIIQRMSQHYLTLLQEICDSPQKSINKFELLTLRERQQILYDWNNTYQPVPKLLTLQNLFERQVLENPQSIAVRFMSQQLSYHELNLQANQLAHYLQNKGLKSTDCVAICLERSILMMVAILGVLKAGVAYVPVDPEFPDNRIDFMLRDSDVRYTLTNHKIVNRLRHHKTIINLEAAADSIREQPSHNPHPVSQGDSVVYMIYTSGTTGNPKGVLCLQSGVCNRLLWMKQCFPLTIADAVLQKITFCFDVSVVEMFWPLISGARLVLAEPGGQKDNHYLFQLICKEKITHCHFVPSMLALFMSSHNIGGCESLKRVFCSGEVLSVAVRDKFFQQSRAELFNLYGPTEASIDATYYHCRRNLHPQTVPIGKPITNVKIYVLDDYLNPVPVGIPGELYIGGVAVARGYHNRVDLTRERFFANPFATAQGERLYKTGDLVRWLEDGNIQYIGRLDHQIKIRGYRIEIQEIESAISRHSMITECVVVSKEEAQDQYLIAYLVLAESDQRITMSEMRAYLAKELPDYMIPAFFVVISEVPKNVNGKVDRKNLLNLNGHQFNLSQKYILPKTAGEKAVAKIWEEVLRHQPIGLHDNFFHIGGNSLNALRVLARIKKKFNTELALRSFFDKPTVKEFAGFLDSLGKKEANKVKLRLVENSKKLISPLIKMNASTLTASARNKIPLFLFHPSGGTVFWSLPLVHHLNNDRLICAFQDPSIESGHLVYQTVEALVTAYITEIRKVQAKGPYLLAGYSIGATLAVETCKQMKQEGEEVAFLGLIDGWGLYPDEYGKLHREMKYYKKAIQELAIVDQSKNLQFNNLEQAQRELHMRYRFPVINQHIHLFKADELSLMFVNVSDEYNHWRRFAAGGITVHTLQGDHETMLLSPNVKQMAILLQNLVKS